MRKRSWLIPSLITVLALMVLAAGCGTTQTQSQSQTPSKTTLKIFYAGSLIIPFDQLEKTFESKYPNVDVEAEGHGSIQVIRHVTDIHEKIDVIITADHALIPMLMYKTNDPDTGKPYADWYAEFATNEMAIGYTDKSKFANEINQNNWYQIINRDGVRFGIADARFDANGYRALMMLKLAEKYYNKPTLFFDTLGGKFVNSITAATEGGQTILHVPEILETKQGSSVVMRGYSVQLLPLLETGDVDYVVEYLSVIKQHGLKYITLPSQVNLGNEQYRDLYKQYTVNLDFQRFASVKPEFVGEPIGYGVTISENATHPKEAEYFINFLLGQDGQKILTDFNHPTIAPALASNIDKMPTSVKNLCTPMPSN